MRAIWVSFVLLAGIVCGWILAAQLYLKAPVVELTGALDPAAAGEAGPDASPDEEARLRGSRSRAQAPAASPGGEPRRASEAVRETPEIVEFLRDGDWAELVQWEKGRLPSGASLDQRGWQALLTLYALAGRGDDFLRAAPQGVAAGVEASTLLELLGTMPASEMGSVVDRLRAALPDTAWPVAALARVYIEAGSPDQAIALVLPELEEGMNDDLARLLVEADPDEAARILGGMASDGDWNGELLGQVGMAFASAKRPELALSFLQDSLAKEPMGYDVIRALSRVDPETALAHARGLTESRGEQQQVWVWLGELEQEVGTSSAAFEAYRQAGQREVSTAVVYGLLKADPERAYETAVALTAESTNDEVLGAVAKVALKSDRPEASMASLRRAHETDPTDHEWNWAMVVLDPAGAAEALTESATTHSGDGHDEVVGALGNALLELGQPDDAYARYLEAHQADPGDWEWQRGLARSDPGRALRVLQARVEAAPEEGDLLGALADAHAGLGNVDQARGLYADAVAKGGGVEWYGRMGQVDPDAAWKGLEEARTKSPRDADVWAAIGEYHRLRGEREAARAAYAEARAISPTVIYYEIRWRALAGD